VQKKKKKKKNSIEQWKASYNSDVELVWQNIQTNDEGGEMYNIRQEVEDA
jgi:hypothetical protein